MYRYILKRVGFILLTVLAVSLVIFFIMDFMPGDAGRNILGLMAPQSAVDELNEKLGENDPFFMRYFRYIYKAFIKLDFGTSYQTGKPVFESIMEAFPYTVRLAAFSMVLTSGLGISIGVLSAIKQYSLADNVFVVFSMVAASIPEFWLGLMLILLFALGLGLLPSYGVSSWTGYILPTITLSFDGTARVLRLTRAQMLETIRADYVRTARAKGASEQAVIWQHAFKSSILPVINSLGVRFGALLGGAVVTESVFALPGLGNKVLNAIYMKDLPVIMGSIIFLTTLFCLIILIVDIISAFIDPRVKARYSA